MFKLIVQSIIELFQKLFLTLTDRRFQRIQSKAKSYSLSQTLSPQKKSRLNSEVNNLINEHAGLSGFYLLENNIDAFISRCKLIQDAEQSLDLQYYYFQGDTSGRLIAQLLVEAANRGVRVRLLLDDIDTLGADEPIRVLNAHPDIEIRIFNPFYFRGLLRYLEIFNISRVGRRMHNKAMIADNLQAIIGGRNIGDIYFSVDQELLFLDIDLLSLGPIVKDISNSFDEYWNSRWAIPVDLLYSKPERNYALRTINKFLKKHLQDVKLTDYHQLIQESGVRRDKKMSELALTWSKAQLFYDAPAKVDDTQHLETRRLINDMRDIADSTESELIIISPYFVPGKQGVLWFKGTVEKGVKVNIITNSLAATDVVAVHSGYATYRQQLLQAGVNLYELKPSAFARERSKFKLLSAGSRTSLHAKTVIVDRKRVFIGSPNLDPRSSELNTEMGLLVDDEVLAAQVMDMFAGVTEKRNSYHLILKSVGENSDEGSRINWLSEENGQQKIYLTDPQVGLWRRFRVFIYRLLPMEELL